MATTADTTAAFDADAAKKPTTEDVEAMRARLEALEAERDERAEDATAADEVEVYDTDGNPVGTAEEADEAPEAPHEAEIAGTVFRFYTPKQSALMAFALGTSNKNRTQLMMKTMQQFIGFHLDEDSFDTFMERMADPQDEWGDNEFGELMNKIVEAGTSSPEARAPKNGPQGKAVTRKRK